MRAAWVVDEMQSADLKDKRLNERLETLLSALGERPTASIPAACGGFNETIAAYRFFDNPKVTAEAILAPHAERTLMRMAQQEVVLLVQDTTDLDFTRPRQQMRGAGSLGSAARWGAFLHPLVAFTVDGTGHHWGRAGPNSGRGSRRRRRRVARKSSAAKRRRWSRRKASAGSQACSRPDSWRSSCPRCNASAWLIARGTSTNGSPSRAVRSR